MHVHDLYQMCCILHIGYCCFSHDMLISASEQCSFKRCHCCSAFQTHTHVRQWQPFGLARLLELSFSNCKLAALLANKLDNSGVVVACSCLGLELLLAIKTCTKEAEESPSFLLHEHPWRTALQNRYHRYSMRMFNLHAMRHVVSQATGFHQH